MRGGLILLLLLPAACAPLVQIGGNAPRPEALLLLSADASAAAPPRAALAAAEALSVQSPVVPGHLQTLRIPVQVSGTAVQYVPDAQWAEPPARMVQRLLAERLAGAGLAVLDPRSAGLTGGRQLTGQLLALGVDVRGAAPVARVRYDATLIGASGIRQRRFEAEEPVARVEGRAVAEALNRAANRVAGDVAAWAAVGAAAAAAGGG